MRFLKAFSYTIFFVLLLVGILNSLTVDLRAQTITTCSNCGEKESTYTSVLQNAAGILGQGGLYSNQVISNIAAIPLNGDLSLNYFTLGFQQNHAYADIIGGPDFELSGLNVAAQNMLFLGLSIGNLIKLSGSNFNLEGLDVYFGKGFTTIGLNNILKIDKTSSKTNSTYFGIRYQLVDAKGASLLSKWQGLNIQLGYLDSSLDVEVVDVDSSPTERTPNIEWMARNQLDYSGNTKSIIVQLDTSVRLVYFLNLNLGLGAAFSSGSNSVVFTRTTPEFECGCESIAKVEFKSIFEQQQNYYLKLGMEWSAPYFHIGIETTQYIRENFINKANQVYSYAINSRIDI